MLIFEIEVESYQGTSSSIRLQDEIEMLVSTIEQTSHSMHKLAGMCGHVSYLVIVKLQSGFMILEILIFSYTGFLKTWKTTLY